MRVGVRARKEALEELWERGLSGQPLLKDQSRLVDEFLADCLNDIDVKGAADSVALVALGGYGRQELFPYSDVDLMILYRPKFKRQIGAVADGILYPLWDTGLEVGHGVRTVKESMRHGRDDFFFQVALVDARLIAGSRELFDELQSAYRKNFVDGCRREFVETMKLFRSERRKRFGAHSYLLEPHIKEGKGGLRDIQAMMWTAKVVFGLNGLDGVVAAGILLAREGEEFSESWNMLVKVRNRLHYISRRKNDQLYFEHQEEITAAFGYTPGKGVLGVEKFMRELYGHLRTVAVTTDLFFEHVDEVLGLAVKGKDAITDKVVEQGIVVRNSRVCFTEMTQRLQQKPQMLMRVFLASAKTGVPVHHRTRKIVSLNLDILTDKVISSSRLSRPFFKILLGAQDVFAVLEAMLETGLLGVYIPEFEKIRSLAQHDLYHIYTVDRHSLQAVAELRDVIAMEPAVFKDVALPRVLYLAVLVHDVGKGAGKDHSVFGAELAKDIGVRVGFSEEESETLSFLIRYHLFLPENALRRDLNDEVFVGRCAEVIGSLDRLAMLYLISVADSRATGPSAWSDWKGALLKELFFKVHTSLETVQHRALGDLINGGHEAQGAAWLRDNVAQILVGEEDVQVDINDLADDYLSSFSPETVARHVMLHAQNRRLLRQKALVIAGRKEEKYSLLIMSYDRPGLLAKICGVLALHNLAVLNAQIFTWVDGTVVDVIDVCGYEGVEYGQEEWEALNRDLNLAISYRLGLGHRLYQKLSKQQVVRKKQPAQVESRVVIDNSVSEKFTVIEVYSVDRPGQLYNITQALADFEVNIFKAFIATEVEQLIDVFYVLDNNDEKIADKAFQQEIKNGLLYAIDRQ